MNKKQIYVLDSKRRITFPKDITEKYGTSFVIVRLRDEVLLRPMPKYPLKALQNEGKDTVEANLALGFGPDLRDYGIGAQILVDLGLKDLQLLTNNPRKIVGLEGYGLRVVERVPIEISARPENARYLEVKREKLGHWLDASASSRPAD